MATTPPATPPTIYMVFFFDSAACTVALGVAEDCTVVSTPACVTVALGVAEDCTVVPTPAVGCKVTVDVAVDDTIVFDGVSKLVGVAIDCMLVVAIVGVALDTTVAVGIVGVAIDTTVAVGIVGVAIDITLAVGIVGVAIDITLAVGIVGVAGCKVTLGVAVEVKCNIW